jgi:hypothetical protein
MKNLSIYTHLKHSIYLFNEEVGEMTFAQLDRTVLGDTDKSSMSKLREAYQAQPYIGAVSQECTTDTHSSVSDFPQEAQAVKKHLLQKTADLANGEWRPYLLKEGN